MVRLLGGMKLLSQSPRNERNAVWRVKHGNRVNLVPDESSLERYSLIPSFSPICRFGELSAVLRIVATCAFRDEAGL